MWIIPQKVVFAYNKIIRNNPLEAKDF